MKKILLLFVTISFLTACSTKKNNVLSNNPVSPMDLSLPDTLQVSLPFRTFWEEFSHEYNPSSKEYVPSEKLQRKYPISEQNGKYMISGYLHTYPSFDKTEIQEMGGKITQYKDSLLSFRIPIDKLPLLVKTKGIKYLEISTRIKLRNQ